jgi:hypothetical protein
VAVASESRDLGLLRRELERRVYELLTCVDAAVLPP